MAVRGAVAANGVYKRKETEVTRKVKLFRWSAPAWAVLVFLAASTIVLAIFLIAFYRDAATFSLVAWEVAPGVGWPIAFGPLHPGVTVWSNGETPTTVTTNTMGDPFDSYIEISDPNGLCDTEVGNFDLKVQRTLPVPDENTCTDLFMAWEGDPCDLVPGQSGAALILGYMPGASQLDDGGFGYCFQFTSLNPSPSPITSSLDIAFVIVPPGEVPVACTATTDPYPACQP